MPSHIPEKIPFAAATPLLKANLIVFHSCPTSPFRISTAPERICLIPSHTPDQSPLSRADTVWKIPWMTVNAPESTVMTFWKVAWR